MTDVNQPLTISLDHSIAVIDTGFVREGMAACYLMEHNGAVAIIETGTNFTTPRIMNVLKAKGIAPSQVKYVIPTHVHLDHAGGAGTLMAQLPEATLVAHPRAARHLIDPEKLIAGATAVYGEERFAEMYGVIQPIPEQRVLVAEDGDTVDLAGRQLLFRDTPGHANHHFCVWDELSRGWFTGDTFGISYREMAFPEGRLLIPTSTPVQFAPQKMIASIELMLSYQPERMYLTHFSVLENPAQYLDTLKAQINAYCDWTLQHLDAESRFELLKQGVMDITFQQAQRLKPDISWQQMDYLALDMELNAQGLDVWASRQQAANDQASK